MAYFKNFWHRLILNNLRNTGINITNLIITYLWGRSRPSMDMFLLPPRRWPLPGSWKSNNFSKTPNLRSESTQFPTYNIQKFQGSGHQLRSSSWTFQSYRWKLQPSDRSLKCTSILNRTSWAWDQNNFSTSPNFKQQICVKTFNTQIITSLACQKLQKGNLQHDKIRKFV